MIARLIGKCVSINQNILEINVGGVVYSVHTPNAYVFNQYLNHELELFTEQIVREDSMTLYGFKSLDEKQMFKELIKVTGIGPKSALAILASSTPSGVVRAIEQEEEGYLIKFPGIGKKTARQIILDLKGKLSHFDHDTSHHGQSTHDVPQHDASQEAMFEEAMLALESLGYSKREQQKVQKALKGKSFDTVDEVVKASFQILIS